MTDKERGFQAWRDWLMYGKHAEDFVAMSVEEFCGLAEKGLRASQSEAVERDAARYRWLSDHIQELPYPDTWGDKAWLDAEIDAAMSSQSAPLEKE